MGVRNRDEIHRQRPALVWHDAQRFDAGQREDEEHDVDGLHGNEERPERHDRSRRFQGERRRIVPG